MFFPSKSKSMIGLDIGSSSIKAVQVTETKGGYRLEKCGIRHLASEMIVDGTIMDAGSVVEAIRGLIADEKIKVKDVALSLSGHSIIIKKIKLPVMTEDELEESIKWEAEQYIPFDINDVNIDFHIIGTVESPDGQSLMEVLLVAAKKDKLTEYTSVVAEVGLNPVVVDADLFALENMYGVNYEIREGEVIALVNIGASVMNINILKNGTSSFTRDISIGGNRYTETIQKDLNMSYDDADRSKKGEEIEGVDPEMVSNVISRVNSEITSEISRSFDFFRTTSAHEEIEKIILSGGSAKITSLPGHLHENIGIAVELADPFRNIEIDKKVFDSEYLKEIAPLATVGLGLAIRRIGDR